MRDGSLRSEEGIQRKPNEMALVACMRKPLTLLNAIAKAGKPWDESIHTA